MSLPKDVGTSLVRGVGAFIRAVPPQELPPALRRFQGFRPQTLLKHQDTLIGALDDADLRATILDWLNEMKPSLPKDDLEALQIAARRDDGWELELAARSTPAEPRPQADPSQRVASAIDRAASAIEKEKEKARRAREDLKRAKEDARKERDAQASQITGLKKELAEAATRNHEARGANDALVRAAATAKADADRSVRKAARALEKAEEDAAKARGELKDARRALTAALKAGDRLAARVEALEARLERLATVPAHAGEPKRKGKGRTPLPVPKGRLPSDPQTLDEWLSAPGVRLLIDGYNVTMAKGGFGDLRLETQRERLVTELTTLVAMKQVPTTVVFDGKDVGRHPARGKKGPVRVQYSKDEIADDHLVAVVQRSPGTPVVVVTSDRELRGRVEELGANVATSPQLLALIR